MAELCNITSDTSACSLEHCIQEVMGFSSRSLSPTDIWLIHFNENTYYEGNPLKYGFVKIFISSDTGARLEVKGLEYEIRVYRDVIKQLFEQRVCPNFVNYLASGAKCNAYEIEDILGVHGPNLAINTLVMANYVRRKFKRPSITSHHTLDQIEAANETLNEILQTHNWRDKITYDFLITETVPNIITVPDLIKKTGKYMSIPLASAIFQIAVACYVMQLSKMTHSDMHTGNIMLFLKEDNSPIFYEIEGTPYYLNTRFVVKIFDFDLTSVERLGVNEYAQRLPKYRALNYVPGLDILWFLCRLSKQTSGRIDDELRNIAFKRSTPTIFKQMHRTTKCFPPLRYINDLQEDLRSPFEMILKIHEMILRIYPSLFSDIARPESRDETWIIDSSLFDVDTGDLVITPSTIESIPIEYSETVESVRSKDNIWYSHRGWSTRSPSSSSDGSGDN